MTCQIRPSSSSVHSQQHRPVRHVGGGILACDYSQCIDPFRVHLARSSPATDDPDCCASSQAVATSKYKAEDLDISDNLGASIGVAIMASFARSCVQRPACSGYSQATTPRQWAFGAVLRDAPSNDFVAVVRQFVGKSPCRRHQTNGAKALNSDSTPIKSRPRTVGTYTSEPFAARSWACLCNKGVKQQSCKLTWSLTARDTVWKVCVQGPYWACLAYLVALTHREMFTMPWRIVDHGSGINHGPALVHRCGAGSDRRIRSSPAPPSRC